MSDWAQILIALFGGGLLKAVVDLWRDRERNVWAEVKRLNDENKSLREKLEACRETERRK